ncbi:NAD-dependent protein deacetylase [Haloprofundus marisrubri]|uniref:NAD-dependent protein deacetylase n=1 Tax=Haloprofundus marisrubri TaxID=1514971 RepID=A0A0W1RD97_9EURY|nr:Sir2 family NAD-dependent protein deacetylase [Haloprofundus marisrubri]KTG11093.1 NAD-dependent protein deacetylase [Haloprofundus marisrubri]
MTDRLDSLAAELRDADSVVALTGAGISVPSGIPPFRGDGGIWGDQFDPAAFHISRFERDPAGFWTDRLELHDAMRPSGIEPNIAHDALATLEREGVLDAVVTQNTDGLHAEAGTQRLVELHGSAERVVCRRCGEQETAGPVRERVRDGETPPHCDCGGVWKPDVVLFGEQLGRETLADARELAEESDAFLAIGSSLQVEPAASLPRTAARDGTLAVVNLDKTGSDGVADYVFRADVTELLPRLLERVVD